MELTVDADRCQGHGRCYDLAPELFDADEDGHAVLLTPGGDVVPGAEAAAGRAVRSCPEQALSLEA